MAGATSVYLNNALLELQQIGPVTFKVERLFRWIWICEWYTLEKKYVSMLSFSKSYLLIHLEMNLEAGVLQISFERSYHKTWKSYSTPDNYGLLERVFQCLA